MLCISTTTSHGLDPQPVGGTPLGRAVWSARYHMNDAKPALTAGGMMRMIHGRFFLGAMLLMLTAVAAQAQIDTVSLRLEPAHVGLAGTWRPGSWAPVLLTIENHSAQPRRVACEMTLPDVDGDLVHARRIVTLTPGPGAVQRVWLYAMPVMSGAPSLQAQVRLIEIPADESVESLTGRVLARATVTAPVRVSPARKAVGILGSPPGLVGLRPYEEAWTQHEPCQLIAGLLASELPDRWYGLSMLESLIWTPVGGDPGAAEIPAAVHESLRQWVWRGGHLVIVLPAVGDSWSGSPLADLLPVRGAAIRSVGDVATINLPTWLGAPLQDSPDRFVLRWFDVTSADGGEAAVLLRDRGNRPMVVAGQYGMGRVTLIGADLTDRHLVRNDLPNPITGNHNPIGVTLWPTVFGWRGPVYSEAAIKALRLDQTQRFRRFTDIDRFIPMAIAMQETAAPALLAAIAVFGLYWLLAGPVSFAALKKRKALHQSWLAFGLVVAVFSLVCWAGAALMRPSHTRAAHFTVLDIDPAQRVVRGRSWLALFVPEYGAVEAALPAPAAGQSDTLVNTGLTATLEQGAFVDPQRYVLDAAAPHRLRLPMRATAKQITLDYIWPQSAGASAAMPSPAWLGVDAGQLPRGAVRLVSGTPVGELEHRLPGTLRDVLVVFAPGAGREPWVWRPAARHWPAGQTLQINGVSGQRLAVPAVRPDSPDRRQRAWSGHLGDLTGFRLLEEQHGQGQAAATISADRRIQLIELLSFFATLPPPDFHDQDVPGPQVFERPLARAIDLTPMLALPRLIVIGHLDAPDTPNPLVPAPLSVDGKPVPATGWTVVRCIVPVQQ